MHKTLVAIVGIPALHFATPQRTKLVLALAQPAMQGCVCQKRDPGPTFQVGRVPAEILRLKKVM